MEGTVGGHAWAAHLQDSELGPDAVPEVFVTLAIWARSLASQGSEGVARARIPAAGGAWYTASAMCTDRDRVAIVLQPAQPAELVSLMLSHFRLTPAERQVTELVLSGRSTREIADDLVVSPHTVQDHLKAVFTKAGVRSRAATWWRGCREPSAELGGPLQPEREERAQVHRRRARAPQGAGTGPRSTIG